MSISLICAVASNQVIGAGNALPWQLPADLKHFKALTMGHHIVMGRKTYESIGKPLPGRVNVVLSRRPGFVAPGCEVAVSLEAALALCPTDEEIFVIGGESVYEQALDKASTIYMTRIHQAFDGDAFFPALDGAVWRETAREDHPSDERNPHAYSFLTHKRVSEEGSSPLWK